jgi:hypothetical protein
LVWFGLVREGASNSVVRAVAAAATAAIGIAGAGVVLLMVLSLLFSHHSPQLIVVTFNRKVEGYVA